MKKIIHAIAEKARVLFEIYRPRSGGTFFVDQLSDEELALFHDPERP